jgi:hypothetical protein
MDRSLRLPSLTDASLSRPQYLTSVPMKEIRMPQLKRMAVAVLLALTCSSVAWAEDVQISAFFGRYEGTGITEKLEGVYYGIAAPDLNIEIGLAANGFYLQWTRVDRASQDRADQQVARTNQRIEFTPSGHSGTYRAIGQDSKVNGLYTWATVSGQSLTVSQMGVDARGGLEIQNYARTLTDLGMLLEASRFYNAEQLLFLRGRMIKVSR